MALNGPATRADGMSALRGRTDMARTCRYVRCVLHSPRLDRVNLPAALGAAQSRAELLSRYISMIRTIRPLMEP